MSSNDNGLISFTGPAGRTYFDRDGVLQTAGKNEIREEYDPLTGAYRGMLIESQERTNIIPNQNLDTLDSSDVFGVVCEPVSDSKMGNVYRVSENSETGVHGIRFIGGLDFEDSHSGYIIVKAGNSRYLTLSLRGAMPPNTNFVIVDMFEGRIMFDRLPDGPTIIEHLGEGWLKIKTGYYRPYAAQRSFDILTRNSENTDWEYEGEGGSFYFKGAQLEKSENPTSLVHTSGLPVTMPGEDARFTDPSVFNNFERGAFYVEFKTQTMGTQIISIDGDNRFLYNDGSGSGEIGFYNRPNAGFTVQDSKKQNKYAVYWDKLTVAAALNGAHTAKSKNVGWRLGPLKIANSEWRGYIKALSYNTNPYTDTEARQLTKLGAATVIGAAPNGGYYDYSDLSTMLVESDESGIPVEDRKIARVGDPIGAVLDKSGHGNHMTASADDRRGILRSNGDNYYIERGASTVYGFDFSDDYSLTVMIALQNYSDRFIVLCDQDGGNGNYAMAYDASTTRDLKAWGALSNPRYYTNGSFKPASNRGDTGSTLQTNPIQLRTLHRVSEGYTNRIFIGGYTSDSWNLTGNEYGFAWGSRLSEDDALIVEQEMRQNMPAISN